MCSARASEFSGLWTLHNRILDDRVSRGLCVGVQIAVRVSQHQSFDFGLPFRGIRN
jgi:hypothetical protein